MLALVIIFLTTLLIATIVVWIYRAISDWYGLNQTVFGRFGTTMQMEISAQQGFITLNPVRRESVRRIRLRSPKGGLKAPWGW
jgi:hypothetical protein